MLPQHQQEPAHIFGQCRFPRHLPSMLRMDQFQPLRMESLAWKCGNQPPGMERDPLRFASVNRVARQGVADRVHVDTNLVRTAGFQAALQ